MTDAIGNPYKGLAAFEDSERDVLFFFGRDRERERITANLIGSRLTVLYGETGVGKSSVLRAGVAHKLRGFEEPLAVVVFDEWRDEPAAGLARAAAQAAGTEAAGSLADTLERCSARLDGQLYLILDGLEEYFLYHPGEDGERGFGVELAQALRRPGLRARFLLSLREDAVIRLDRFKRVIPNLFGNYLRLEHLDREAARVAIVGPLERYNELAGSDRRVEIEPKLVAAVLDEVAAGQVGLGRTGDGAIAHETDIGRVATPYLQLVMHRLWDAEADEGSNVLRHSTFRELGGAESIVHNHLRRALGTLGPAQQALAAEAFSHLVTPSGTKIAHTASDLARYAGVDESELLAVLLALVDERIVRPTADEKGTTRYEIYHDVLADAVAAWRVQHESAREVDRVRQAAARKHRRLLVIAVIALLIAGAMAAVTIFALSQRSEARTQARKAQVQAEKARARSLEARAGSLEASAVSLLQTDPELSVLLAVRAAELDPGRAAEDVLRRALLASRVRAVLRADGPVVAVRESPDGSRVLVAGGHVAFVYERQGEKKPLLKLKLHQGATIVAADYSLDGRWIMTAGSDGRVLIWPARTGTHPRKLSAGHPVRSAMFDHSGTLIAAAGDHEVNVWRVAGGRLAFARRFPWIVTDAVFSPDERLIAVIGNHRAVLLFKLDGRPAGTLPQGDVVSTVVFRPDGKMLFVAGQRGRNLLWNLNTRKQRPLRGNDQPQKVQVLKAAFSPNGKILATASPDGRARLWDVASGQFLRALSGHTHFVVDVAFRPRPPIGSPSRTMDPGGKYLVTSGTDGTARVWRTQTGEFQVLLAGDSDAVTTVMYSHTRGQVLTGSADATARLWDVQTKPRLQPLPHAQRLGGALLEALYIGRRGSRILTAGPGRKALLLRAKDGSLLRSFKMPGPVSAVASTRDGTRVAVAAGTRVVVFDSANGKELARHFQPSKVTAVAISPTRGPTLVTGGEDGSLRAWSLYGRGRPRIMKGHSAAITDVAFSRDGRRIATASDDATARIWDAKSGRSLHTLTDGDKKGLTSVSWGPRGHRLVTASKDAAAWVWNAHKRRWSLSQILRWHLGPVSDAAFSPNGRWIVTTGPSLLQLWQPDFPGALPEPFYRLGIIGKPPMTTTTFDPNSRQLLTANRRGTLWNLYKGCNLCQGLGGLLKIARRRLKATGRTLTTDERNRYGLRTR